MWDEIGNYIVDETLKAYVERGSNKRWAFFTVGRPEEDPHEADFKYGTQSEAKLAAEKAIDSDYEV